ncbi:MAG: hypothetical protein L6R40_001878 [Gallowayella cf. fulva]|nr:MAG: hypothetical protein L6R40_001878 [Xanthomendoza cf. fulva]
MAPTVAPAGNVFDRSERQPSQQEQTEERLRKSISYWQASDEEYKGMREALRSLGVNASVSAINAVGKQSLGKILNEKEINLLLKDERSGPRTGSQIVGLLSRRIEYVQSNVTSLRSQLQAAGGQSNSSQHPSRTEHDDVGEFPLMEIQEELDEDDNIISSSITPASVAAPHIAEALRKAGINDLSTSLQDETPPYKAESEPSDTRAVEDPKTTSPILKQTDPNSSKPCHDQQPSPSTSESDSKGDNRKAGRRRKSVTFADGTKQAPPTSTEPRSAKDLQAAKAASVARRVKAEVRGSVDALKKVHNAGFISDEVFDRFRQEYVARLQTLPSTVFRQPVVSSQTPSSPENLFKTPKSEDFSPVIPSNESSEDAALRREMLRYHMDEVGAVVAEMHLDEDEQSDRSNSEDPNDENQRQHSSDEDENDWGMSTNRALSNDYIKEMQALEHKLKAKSMQNIGPSADIETILQAEKNLEIGPDGNPIKQSPSSLDQSRKAVRFAKALDVQERPSSPKSVNSSQPRVKKAVGPGHADIVERQTPASHSPTATAPRSKKKASRIRSSLPPDPRAVAALQHPPPLQMQVSNGNPIKTPSLPAFTPPATPKMAPTGPPGRTHTPNVIERPYNGASDTERASEPDEFDAALLQQELTMDYHRTRNRMIQRQGGFVATEEENEREEAEGPLVDEKGKKISRFKAARLQALGG